MAADLVRAGRNLILSSSRFQVQIKSARPNLSSDFETDCDDRGTKSEDVTLRHFWGRRSADGGGVVAHATGIFHLRRFLVAAPPMAAELLAELPAEAAETLPLTPPHVPAAPRPRPRPPTAVSPRTRPPAAASPRPQPRPPTSPARRKLAQTESPPRLYCPTLLGWMP